jgi:putative transposase
MVGAPGEYPWSSYRANALGEADSIVMPRPLYFVPAPTADGRIVAYRKGQVVVRFAHTTCPLR